MSLFKSSNKKNLTYKEEFDVEHRISESNRILAKHGGTHIPVIVDCDASVGVLKKKKFLVPHDINCANLIASIRKQIDLDSSKAIFLFYDDKMLCPTSMVGEVYQKHMEDKRQNKKLSDREKADKFMYFLLQSESTFGSL